MKKVFICFWFITLLFHTALLQAQRKPALYSSVNEVAMNKWVDSVYDSMTDLERIGQLFMVVADPSSNSANVTKLLKLVREQKIGGVLFHKGEPESQIMVTNRLQKEANVPLLIALDGEWGLSMRLEETPCFPKNMMLGAISDLDLLEEYGEEVGRQCKEMGIHVNFAPVADVNNNHANPVIGIRSFGEDPEDVAERVVAYSRGLEKAGIIAVAKHFPGHGDTSNDSHLSLPTINHSRDRLDEVEIYPFERFINSGFSGIMVAHLDIPALGTNGRPGSLSKNVTTKLLRDELGFSGLCFTDGLAMKGAAAAGNENICVLALQAGNDILLGPPNPEKGIEAVRRAVREKKLDVADLNKRCRRVLCYKYIVGLNNFSPVSAKNWHRRLNSPHSEWLKARLSAEAMTIVKNDNRMLPLKSIDKKRIAALSIGGGNNNAFLQMLNRYMSVDCYAMPANADSKTKSGIYEKLKQYDLVICGIHDSKILEDSYLREMALDKEVVLAFFTIPYHCAKFRNSITQAKAIVVAYENTDCAQEYAAQAIFGGISVMGTLPVSIPGLYPLGTGHMTEKIRLGYHQPEEVGLDATVLRRIDAIVREGIAEEAYPGCQVLVAKDGYIVFNKAYGYYDYSNKQAVTERTVYDLASSSKATGTLLTVMKAYDEGYFKLTDKISTYVTGLKRSDKENIVIKDMLYHQSGLPATILFYEQAILPGSYSGSLTSGKKDSDHPVQFDTRTYVNNTFRYDPNVVSKTKKKGFTTEVARNFYVSDAFAGDSIIAGIRRAPMGKTGRYVYSCVNFILLKMMVEQQTGVPMDVYFNRNFANRLGASSTTYNPLHKMDTLRIAPTEIDRYVRRQTVRGYVHDESAAFQGGVSGNAGLFSSANDLAKIMQLYLNEGTYGGERLLSGKTCRLFTGSKCPTSRRGLGFDKPDTGNPNRSPCGLLTPASVYGHTGFTGTCFWVDPENNMFYVFLSNRTYPSRSHKNLFTMDIRTRIQDTIYEAMGRDGEVSSE